MNPWPSSASHRAWLDRHCVELLEFGRRFPHPRGGAAYLDEDGNPLLDRPVEAYATARMAHVYALGTLLGIPGCAPVVDRALDGLVGLLHDDAHGGWYESTQSEVKSCYAHAFVILGSSSAVVAGRPRARDLLDEAVRIFTDYFWDDAAGMCVDEWDTAWSAPAGYRGMNANMHSVEALLAAADVTGDGRYREMATRISGGLVEFAHDFGWRIPEHFTGEWKPQPDYNRDHPDDRFKPYGATVGHALEWSRLLLQANADRFGQASEALFARAVEDGWSADGEPGFVYTTDWDGRPVVRDRMHWVAAEAVGAAATLFAYTGSTAYADRYAEWWDYIECYLHDGQRGSWHHQLDASNRPISTVWPGKPDLYHAVQATLVPRLPRTPSMATALAGL